MVKRDLFHDASSHAASQLESVLQRDSDSKEPDVPLVSFEEAMQDERVFQQSSKRDNTRVLFISQNLELLNPTQQTLDGYLNIADVFDEVHILILRRGITPKQPVLRPQKNVWIYIAASRHWWQILKHGQEMLQQQLMFVDGFRSDLVVARDPFESALIALWVGKKFNKPTQLHVLVNYYDANRTKKALVNWLQRLIARYTIPRFISIRTSTKKIQQILLTKYNIKDTQRLPQFNAYEAISQIRQTLDLKVKYPQYVFNLLFVGSLNQHSTANIAIDAARFMLLNKRIALIVVGDGSAYQDCQRHAKQLGVDQQLIFERRDVDIAQYLKAANLLIVTDTDQASEELVLQAAAAQIPMVMVGTEAREDIFTHLESAYICQPGDVQAVSDGIYELMNNFALRQHICEQAHKVVTTRFHQNPEDYRKKYRDSIEQALFADEAEVAAD